WRGASVRALHSQGPRRRFRRALRSRSGAAAVAGRCPRVVDGRNSVDGTDGRAAATGERAGNPGVVLHRALGAAIRPRDDHRARRLPPAAAPAATGAMVNRWSTVPENALETREEHPDVSFVRAVRLAEARLEHRFFDERDVHQIDDEERP